MPPPVSHAPAAPEDDKSVATFKLQVNLVDLFFTVKDKNGNLVPHLNKNDCTVFEDKQPQTFKSFVAENNLPLTLGILLDTSGSQQRVLPLEQDAGSQFPGARAQSQRRSLSAVLRRERRPAAGLHQQPTDADPGHEQGGDQHRRRQRRSGHSRSRRRNGAHHRRPQGTLLYDAIYLAANEKLNQESGRKAMIILTDGDDQGSRIKISEAIAAAQKSNVMIYVILIADTGFYGGWGYNGYSAAKRMSEGDRRPADQRRQ